MLVKITWDARQTKSYGNDYAILEVPDAELAEAQALTVCTVATFRPGAIVRNLLMGVQRCWRSTSVQVGLAGGIYRR